MKRRAAEPWFPLAFCVCFVAACTPVTAVPSVTVAAEPLPAILRIGTSGDYSPFSVAEGKPLRRAGFDIDVARRLAADLGVQIQWVPFRWPELQSSLEANQFDIAMGGITWRPTRAIVGAMTHAVAVGAPCLLGDLNATRIGVNRGGALQAWAAQALPDRELVAFDDNRSLPEQLAKGQVGAIVTDSFELSSFAREGWQSRCELASWRKVYWLAPAVATPLGPRVAQWLLSHSEFLQQRRSHWFGSVRAPSVFARLDDLLARRLAIMPHVAAYKLKAGLPVEDLKREAQLLAKVGGLAKKWSWNALALQRLFQLQMQLAKAVQRRDVSPVSLDLGSELRPLLSKLGAKIVDELARLQETEQLGWLQAHQLPLVSQWLDAAETDELAAALRGPWTDN